MTENQHKGWHSRGYLPHIDDPEKTQYITFRLADSLPQQVLQRLDEDQEISKLEKQGKLEEYLDNGYGECLLKIQEIASIVQETLLKFDGERYNLISWVIMPNHVHVIIEQYYGDPLDKIMHSWKSYTSTMANRKLNRKGRFWQPDYFDRYIRNPRMLEEKIDYIDYNPVAAGLVEKPADWTFSSARYYVDTE